MKIGILGSGFMGRTHAGAFAKVPDVQIVSMSSRSLDKARKEADKVGAKATTNDMEIVNDPTIDAISITLPTHLHREYVLAAFKAGKDVLLEKPFGLTTAECDDMIAAQKQSGKCLMIAQVLRFWPEYVALADFVRSGKLGKPLSAVAARLSVPPDWADWFADPQISGGAVLDLMVHDLDAANWVFGQPLTVYARGHEAKPGLWNDVRTLVDYGTGHAAVEGSQFMPKDYPFTAMLRVICEGGTVEYHLRAGGTSVEMGGGSSVMVYQPGRAYKLETPGDDGYATQAAYFVDCVRQKRVPTLGTPEQARLAVQLSNATRQSLETAKVVAL